MKTGYDNLLDDDAIEGGAWMHVLDPRDDEPMFLNGDESKPMRVKVRSTASQAYRDYLEGVQRKSIRKVVGGTAKRSRDKIAADAARDDKPDRFAVLVAAFENDGAAGIRTPTQDELKAWASNGKVRWLVDQTLDFADDPSQYGGEEAVGKPSAETQSQTS